MVLHQLIQIRLEQRKISSNSRDCVYKLFLHGVWLGMGNWRPTLRSNLIWFSRGEHSSIKDSPNLSFFINIFLQGNEDGIHLQGSQTTV